MIECAIFFSQEAYRQCSELANNKILNLLSAIDMTHMRNEERNKLLQDKFKYACATGSVNQDVIDQLYSELCGNSFISNVQTNTETLLACAHEINGLFNDNRKLLNRINELENVKSTLFYAENYKNIGLYGNTPVVSELKTTHEKQEQHHDHRPHSGSHKPH